MAILKCSRCKHKFDSRDKRGYVADVPSRHTCPACWIMNIQSTGAWAVWNDCNGVFEVQMRKAEAVELLATAEYTDCDCSVIPVRVIEVPKDDRHFYEWEERQLTEGRA